KSPLKHHDLFAEQKKYNPPLSRRPLVVQLQTGFAFKCRTPFNSARKLAAQSPAAIKTRARTSESARDPFCPVCYLAGIEPHYF
ncbi:MAG TPA: hypothetical protein PLP42_19870, partial [Acidobacteriota bacterium]|nr:hypothetical protein [Acidobacteriota bacterium]